ncbi:MAG: sporulation protein YqfC [Peptococcaceae bacterium]|nr:sporulation protein YqfC [Peptococcaceae bacterium]
MGWREFKKRLKRQMSDMLEIPGDVIMDLPKVVLVGDLQLFIENHRGIVEYTAENVRINAGDYEVAVSGEGLLLRNILPDEICLEGRIKSVQFIR